MFFKKWKERIEGEIRLDLVELLNREKASLSQQISEIHKSILREKKEWDDFLAKQEAKVSNEIEQQKQHSIQIERGLRMCEESLEIIKKLLEERK